jgi:hypothetical protein
MLMVLTLLCGGTQLAKMPAEAAKNKQLKEDSYSMQDEI